MYSIHGFNRLYVVLCNTTRIRRSSHHHSRPIVVDTILLRFDTKPQEQCIDYRYIAAAFIGTLLSIADLTHHNTAK